MIRSKKGMSAMVSAIQVIITVGIIVGIGLLILVTNQSMVANLTITSMAQFADWLPIIVIGVVVMMLLGLVLGSFRRTKSDYEGDDSDGERKYIVGRVEVDKNTFMNHENRNQNKERGEKESLRKKKLKKSVSRLTDSIKKDI